MFDELTETDLSPVKSVARPGMAPVGPAASSTNPYAPTASGGQMYQPPGGGGSIAGAGKRLLGSIVDTLFIAFAFAIGFGIVVAMGAAIQGEPSDAMAILSVVVLAAPALIAMAINAYLISTSGQTVGKKAVGSRIVMRDTRQLPGFVHGWLLRTLVFSLAGQIVPFLPLIDSLFVFSEEARTLHDRLAGTVVVDT